MNTDRKRCEIFVCVLIEILSILSMELVVDGAFSMEFSKGNLYTF